jgi:hypothetical protein
MESKIFFHSRISGPSTPVTVSPSLALLLVLFKALLAPIANGQLASVMVGEYMFLVVLFNLMCLVLLFFFLYEKLDVSGVAVFFLLYEKLEQLHFRANG